MQVTHIPHTGARVESGPLRFTGDWTGLFLRGDNAFAVAMAIMKLEDFYKKCIDHEIDADFAMRELSALKNDILNHVVEKRK